MEENHPGLQSNHLHLVVVWIIVLLNLRHLLSLNAVREKTCVPCLEIGTGVLLTQLAMCHWCPCSIAWEQESEFPYKTGRTEKAFFSGLYEMFFILKKKSAKFFVVEKSQHCCNRGHLATQFDQGFWGVRLGAEFFSQSKIGQEHPSQMS